MLNDHEELKKNEEKEARDFFLEEAKLMHASGETVLRLNIQKLTIWFDAF